MEVGDLEDQPENVGETQPVLILLEDNNLIFNSTNSIIEIDFSDLPTGGLWHIIKHPFNSFTYCRVVIQAEPRKGFGSGDCVQRDR